MPVEDLLGGPLRFIVRLIAWFFLELIIEFLFKGPGLVYAKLTSKPEREITETYLLLFGVAFWGLVAALIFAIIKHT